MGALERAQALVEFALVLPVLLLVLLGFGEAAFLAATQQGYQNGADVMVQWAAEEMASSPGESWRAGWSKVVRSEAERAGCDDLDPAVTFPDDAHRPGDRVRLRWSCHYDPVITGFWSGLLVSVQSSAVVPGIGEPSPQPSALPSAS